MFNLKNVFIILSWLVLSLTAQGQVLQDPAAQQLIIKALDSIYNMEFVEADALVRQIQTRYPQHPVGLILRATQLDLQNLPISDNKAATAQFVQSVEQAMERSKRMLDKNEDDPEAVFFMLTCHSYMASLYHNRGESLKAVGESKKAYSYLRDGFKLMDKNPDFYFTSGLYNYYVERYPMDHPIVRPFMFFFADGDIALGIKQMDVATHKGLFMRPVANYYLSHILMKYEGNPARAAVYTKYLIDKYPDNPLFAMSYAEALLMSGRYAEARPYVQHLKQMPHKLVPLAYYTFSGMLAEYDKNDKEAIQLYDVALKQYADEAYTKEYQAFVYAGLARIAARANNRNQAKLYYKKALAIAEYKSIIREAKAYK
ncbi:tetratricopeptide repeat protein [Spirosoma sp. KNUC1025]|uniref:tetratricopeptide repeat protein n=1 Tax=Spirosoma sp. KNUC1025 TaxID=2894082 RepID=UPI003870AEC0|nr:tetratricopeptide repeat protein [Spirosoma sp. KNUC1025]